MSKSVERPIIPEVEVQKVLNEYPNNKTWVHEKLKSVLASYRLDGEGAKNVAIFMRDLPEEERRDVWALLQFNVENLFILHPYIGELMILTATGKPVDHLNLEDVKVLKQTYGLDYKPGSGIATKK